jgi:hypothetical protein
VGGGEELPPPQAFKPSKTAASPATATLTGVRKKLIGNILARGTGIFSGLQPGRQEFHSQSEILFSDRSGQLSFVR